MTTPHTSRPPQQYYPGPPPAGLPPNMWPPQHSNGAQRGPWQPAYPPPQPETPKRPRNIPAIISVSLAAVGLVWFWLHVMLFATVFGLAALVLGVIGNHRALKRNAPLGRLAMLGVLLGLLVMLASLGS